MQSYRNTFLFKFFFDVAIEISEKEIYDIAKEAIWSCSENSTEGEYFLLENDQMNYIGHFPMLGSANASRKYIPKLAEQVDANHKDAVAIVEKYVSSL